MKVYNYIIMITGMLLLLAYAGIPLSTNILAQLGITTGSFALTSSAFWNYLFGTAGILLIGTLTSAIAIGYFTKSPTENYIILGFIVSWLYIFVSSFVSLINYSLEIGGWISAVIMLILAPLSVGMIIALVEFFRGTD